MNNGQADNDNNTVNPQDLSLLPTVVVTPTQYAQSMAQLQQYREGIEAAQRQLDTGLHRYMAVHEELQRRMEAGREAERVLAQLHSATTAVIQSVAPAQPTPSSSSTTMPQTTPITAPPVNAAPSPFYRPELYERAQSSRTDSVHATALNPSLQPQPRPYLQFQNSSPFTQTPNPSTQQIYYSSQYSRPPAWAADATTQTQRPVSTQTPMNSLHGAIPSISHGRHHHPAVQLPSTGQQPAAPPGQGNIQQQSMHRESSSLHGALSTSTSSADTVTHAKTTYASRHKAETPAAARTVNPRDSYMTVINLLQNLRPTIVDHVMFGVLDEFKEKMKTKFVPEQIERAAAYHARIAQTYPPQDQGTIKVVTQLVVEQLQPLDPSIVQAIVYNIRDRLRRPSGATVPPPSQPSASPQVSQPASASTSAPTPPSAPPMRTPVPIRPKPSAAVNNTQPQIPSSPPLPLPRSQPSSSPTKPTPRETAPPEMLNPQFSMTVLNFRSGIGKPPESQQVHPQPENTGKRQEESEAVPMEGISNPVQNAPQQPPPAESSSHVQLEASSLPPTHEEERTQIPYPAFHWISEPITSSSPQVVQEQLPARDGVTGTQTPPKRMPSPLTPAKADKSRLAHDIMRSLGRPTGSVAPSIIPVPPLSTPASEAERTPPQRRRTNSLSASPAERNEPSPSVVEEIATAGAVELAQRETEENVRRVLGLSENVPQSEPLREMSSIGVEMPMDEANMGPSGLVHMMNIMNAGTDALAAPQPFATTQPSAAPQPSATPQPFATPAPVFSAPNGMFPDNGSETEGPSGLVHMMNIMNAGTDALAAPQPFATTQPSATPAPVFSAPNGMFPDNGSETEGPSGLVHVMNIVNAGTDAFAAPPQSFATPAPVFSAPNETFLDNGPETEPPPLIHNMANVRVKEEAEVSVLESSDNEVPETPPAPESVASGPPTSRTASPVPEDVPEHGPVGTTLVDALMNSARLQRLSSMQDRHSATLLSPTKHGASSARTPLFLPSPADSDIEESRSLPLPSSQQRFSGMDMYGDVQMEEFEATQNSPGAQTAQVDRKGKRRMVVSDDEDELRIIGGPSRPKTQSGLKYRREGQKKSRRMYVLMPPMPAWAKRYKRSERARKTRRSERGLSPTELEDELDEQRRREEELHQQAVQLSCSRLRESPCLWQGCDVVMASAESLVRHVVQHTESLRSGMFACRWRGCAKIFHTKGALQRHLVRHASHPLFCAFQGCDRSFESSKELYEHHQHFTHNEQVLRRTPAPFVPVLEPLPPLPEVVPSWLIIPQRVSRHPIDRGVHQWLGARVLEGISTYNFQGGRLHAGASSRKSRRLAERVAAVEMGGKSAQEKLELLRRLPDDEYDNIVGERPLKASQRCEDLNSGMVSQYIHDGLVLFPPPGVSDGWPPRQEEEESSEGESEPNEERDELDFLHPYGDEGRKPESLPLPSASTGGKPSSQEQSRSQLASGSGIRRLDQRHGDAAGSVSAMNSKETDAVDGQLHHDGAPPIQMSDGAHPSQAYVWPAMEEEEEDVEPLLFH